MLTNLNYHLSLSIFGNDISYRIVTLQISIAQLRNTGDIRHGDKNVQI